MSRTEPATLRRVATVEANRLRLPARLAGAGTGSPRGGDVRERIVVRLSDTAGRDGWGEIPIQDEVPDHIWNSLVTDYAPRLLTHTWTRPTDAQHAWTDLPWAPTVQAGLDTACWVLWSRQHATPLAHSLGGNRTAIPAGATLGIQPDPELMVRAANRQVGRGIRRLRVEVAPGHDLEPIRALRESYPHLALQVACGGRYQESAEDLRTLHGLDSLELVAIEQPFAATDLAAHARLQRELRTPLALGRDVDSLATLDAAIAARAVRALQLHPARLGGLTQARRAHDRAVDAGWQVWCGADGMAGPGLAAQTALASLPGITLPSDIPLPTERRGRWLVDPPIRSHHGLVPVPLTEAGLGHTVNEAVLREHTVTSTVLHG
ncbi:enolase C-terminal domain-like protein [Lipingzhangella sp. LS1_29]|uniref:Enolase C-terminal domain-like protein n=1 Tax=Lipingzhangella rawalii TaxID=2055835 RepID=A0ABU2H2P2_9ACTN|nr:enolase C-terminal domain-like protein [Lipingzhangella rawalii]MDS1269568.1 enolase C-terminal domain-like protein [Lipingzhangella rawalii]